MFTLVFLVLSGVATFYLGDFFERGQADLAPFFSSLPWLYLLLILSLIHIFAAGVPELGIGYLGVALAFGLSVLTMAYAIGPISGAHLNLSLIHI